MMEALRIFSNNENGKRVKLLVTEFIKVWAPPNALVFHWFLTHSCLLLCWRWLSTKLEAVVTDTESLWGLDQGCSAKLEFCAPTSLVSYLETAYDLTSLSGCSASGMVPEAGSHSSHNGLAYPRRSHRQNHTISVLFRGLLSLCMFLRFIHNIIFIDNLLFWDVFIYLYISLPFSCWWTAPRRFLEWKYLQRIFWLKPCLDLCLPTLWKW